MAQVHLKPGCVLVGKRLPTALCAAHTPSCPCQEMAAWPRCLSCSFPMSLVQLSAETTFGFHLWLPQVCSGCALLSSCFCAMQSPGTWSKDGARPRLCHCCPFPRLCWMQEDARLLLLLFSQEVWWDFVLLSQPSRTCWSPSHHVDSDRSCVP